VAVCTCPPTAPKRMRIGRFVATAIESTRRSRDAPSPPAGTDGQARRGGRPSSPSPARDPPSVRQADAIGTTDTAARRARWKQVRLGSYPPYLLRMQGRSRYPETLHQGGSAIVREAAARADARRAAAPRALPAPRAAHHERGGTPARRRPQGISAAGRPGTGEVTLAEFGLASRLPPRATGAAAAPHRAIASRSPYQRAT
jgi:hypothetical protein